MQNLEGLMNVTELYLHVNYTCCVMGEVILVLFLFLIGQFKDKVFIGVT